jgi:hypothetical protein
MRKTWRTKSILVGVSIHFLLWLILSVWLWLRNSQWYKPSLLLYVLFAPVRLGFFYLGNGADRSYLGWAVAGLAVSAALITLVVNALNKRLRWIVLLTHLTVLLYWLIGSVLIAAGE